MMKMKRNIFIITAAFCMMASSLVAQEIVKGVSVEDFKAERNGNYMKVDMTLDVFNLQVKRNRAVLLTPCVINSDDSLHLNSIGVYGRRRYLQTIRNMGEGMLSGEGEITYRMKDLPYVIELHDMVPYEKWMEGAEFQLHSYLYGCCEFILGVEAGSIGSYSAFVPEFLYVTPKAEVKTRSLEGTAYVDFVVDKTDISPDYHDNAAELGKIQATIDSVRGDGDIIIDSIWLKGYASPEGVYAHNDFLASGRATALKDYVRNLMQFDDSLFIVSHVAENWEDLRWMVDGGTLEHKMEILELIDSDMEPDRKETKIKATYPTEYRSLLQNYYPYLRRTDYRVHYTVRGYSDVEEIKRILKTQPQKLSLNEMYIVAQTLEPGSDEYIEVFEVAVRMYPDDPIANLNAANVEMRHGEYAKAAQYLSKAGNAPEAEYARGVYCYLTDDYGTARGHLNIATRAGIEQAATLLENMK